MTPPTDPFELAVETARQNIPVKIECRVDPDGFEIRRQENGRYSVNDIEPQAPGGVLPLAERTGTLVALVDLDGVVEIVEECDKPGCVYARGHMERSTFPHRVELPVMITLMTRAGDVKEGDVVDFEPVYRERLAFLTANGDTDDGGEYGDTMANLMAAEDHYFEVEGVEIEPCVDPAKPGVRTLAVIYTPDGSWAFGEDDLVPVRVPESF